DRQFIAQGGELLARWKVTTNRIKRAPPRGDLASAGTGLKGRGRQSLAVRIGQRPCFRPTEELECHEGDVSPLPLAVPGGRRRLERGHSHYPFPRAAWAQLRL